MTFSLGTIVPEIGRYKVFSKNDRKYNANRQNEKQYFSFCVHFHNQIISHFQVIYKSKTGYVDFFYLDYTYPGILKYIRGRRDKG